VTELRLQEPSGRVLIGLAASRFNHFVTAELVAGARDALERCGIGEDRVVLAWVPGAFELPLAADRLLADGGCDAVVALGAIIRGSTPHFDYVAGECSAGLSRVALKHGKPVAFGVLTTDTVEQALERAARGEGNKGFDAAMAALHMLGMLERLGRDGD
jgi:6,7-dimethyl-8-ribityllumazine synthase